MGILNRIQEAFEAKLNMLIDNSTNPSEELDLMYQKYLEHLVEAKNNATDVRTSINQIVQQKTAAEGKIKLQEGKAKDALAKNDEKTALAACERKLILEKQVADIDGKIVTAKESEKVLLDRVQDFESKVETIKLKKEVMKAQYNCVQAQVKINEAVTGLAGVGSVGDTIRRVQEKTDKAQARADAIQDLTKEGVLKDHTDDGLDTEVSETDIKAELERIRVADKSA